MATLSKKTAFLLKIIIIFAVYIITARLGLMLDAVGGFATLVWFPTGISLASLLIFGPKFWPAISTGAFFANWLNGAPIMVAAGIGLGNTLEAVIGAYLLKRFVDFENSLQTLKDVLGLIFLAALFSTLISATIGVSALLLGGVITVGEYYKTWLAWWVGDMVSNLVIAPLILVWSDRFSLRFNLSFSRVIEIIGLALSLIVINILIFREYFNFGVRTAPGAYLIFPTLIWVALRFGTRAAVTVIFIVSILAVVITSLGYGPFAIGSLNQSLLSVQLYMVVMSVSALILAAVANERQELEDRKDEFISIASHELKTPITTIKGYTQILNQFLKGSKNQKPLFYISKMEDQLNRLTKLVNDLLDVSKIQAGKLQLQKEKVDMKALIESVISDLQLVIKHKLNFKSDGKDMIIWADKYHLNTVLVNLISNAVKYSPKSDLVNITALRNDSNLIVKVEDFGIGISKKDQKNVFEKFFRADNRIRQSFSGLGLGLYIASEIIRQHQGEIWLDSVKGKGTVVSFKLPIKKNLR